MAMVAIGMIALVLLMIIPGYGIPADPSPKKVEYEVLNKISLVGNDHPQNISRTLNNAQYLATPTLSIKQAADIISIVGCPYDEEICYAKALYAFVQQHISYIKDPVLFDFIKTPQETLISKAGDCDDQAILLASLMQSVGIPTQLIVTPNHMLIKIYLPNARSFYKDDDGWIFLDPTCKTCRFGQLPPAIDKTAIRSLR
ncbi:MAG: transglutaminase-like domain-containing protein [Candidatus Woesearchaeota archaeon]